MRISEQTLYTTASALLARVDAERHAGHNPVDAAFEAVGMLRAFVEGYAEAQAPTPHEPEAWDDILCGWCGEPAEADICAACQERYETREAE